MSRIDPYFLAAIILYGLALFNCYRALSSHMSPGATFAWILVNLGMPVVGVPLYFLVGNNRITGYVKRHKKRTKELAYEKSFAEDTSSQDNPSEDPELDDQCKTFRRIFAPFGPTYLPQAGSVDLLIDGSSTFDAIFAAIRDAKHYILVQYYILRSDRLGLELKKLLISKSKEGIPVYLLYDDMGSFWLSRKYIKDLQQAGIKVEKFLPIRSFKRFFQVNFRNHRKLVAVDGIWAFTGGLNVGEEYATRRYKAKSRLRKYWRDTHVKISGGAVKQLEEIFLEDWYFATDEMIEIKNLTTRAPQPVDPTPKASQRPIIQVIHTGPADDIHISILLLMQIFNQAKRRLWIATPYLVPDQSLIRSLELAALRGVDVRMLLPRRADQLYFNWISSSYGEQLKRKGIKVLLYEKGMMHQKVILADNGLVAVGTMNLDNRALYLNFETTVLIHDRTFAQTTEKMFHMDFTGSTYLTEERRSGIRHLKKLRDNALRLFAPLL